MGLKIIAPDHRLVASQAPARFKNTGRLMSVGYTFPPPSCYIRK